MSTKYFNPAFLIVYVLAAGIIYIVTAFKFTIFDNGVHAGSVLVFIVALVTVIYSTIWLMRLVIEKIRELEASQMEN